MKSKFLLVVGMGMMVGLTMPQQAVAQDGDGPGTRTVSVTTFDVPYGPNRGPALTFMRNRMLPATQLNPNIITSRVLFHAWGSNADQVIMVAEYADMEGLAAGCGQPCADWNEANPAPEEGDEGYEAFDKGRTLFFKYYSHHTDEIYSAPMGITKNEGEVLGRVGPASDEDD